MTRKRLVLAGAGHSHLLLLERLESLRAAGLDPLLIAPRFFDYSGLATGVLWGALPPDANRIDIAALAQRLALAFVEGTVASFDAAAREMRLEDGTRVPYDLLSLATGSEVQHRLQGDGPIWPVKPLSNFTRLRAALEAGGAASRIVIAGSGVTGTEVAACLAGLARRTGKNFTITLVGPPHRGWPTLYRSLEQRGVKRLPERRVVELHGAAARLNDGSEIGCDHLVIATGLDAAPGTPVAATLRSLDDPAIFASGDCAKFTPPLPKHGVFGVRQAPILAHNLIAAAHGKPLLPYRPQRRFLSILDLGNGEGFATWGRLSNRSRAALRLKRHLDFAFVRRFRP